MIISRPKCKLLNRPSRTKVVFNSEHAYHRCLVNVLTSSRNVSIFSYAFYDLFPLNNWTMHCAKGIDVYKIDGIKTNFCKFYTLQRSLSPKFKHFVQVHFPLIATYFCINVICSSCDCPQRIRRYMMQF